jgi:hypothetical protein
MFRSDMHSKSIGQGPWYLNGFLTVLLAAGPGLLVIVAAPPSFDHSGFSKAWTLNREASTATPAFVPGGGGRPDGGGRGGGGFGGGFGGGARGGGFGERGGGGRGGLDPKEMQQQMELAQEAMAPAQHWVITQSEGAITFADQNGRSRRFATGNQKEKHQLEGGTIETTTRWEGAQLRQEIKAGGSTKIVRTYEISPEGQLVVTTKISGSEDGRGREPMRAVYDADQQ